MWDLKTGQLIHNLKGHSYAVHAIAISPDGQTLVSGSSDATMKLWNLKTGQLIRTFSNVRLVSSVAISADGQTLASTSYLVNPVSGTTPGLKLWNLKTGQMIRTIQDSAPPRYIYAMHAAISPDAQTLAGTGGL